MNGNTPIYEFGLDQNTVAARLYELADKVKEGKIFFTMATFGHNLVHEEYKEGFLTLNFNEKD